MRHTELSLSKREREAVEAFRSRGAHMVREFNRAHILATLNRRIPEQQIMEVLGVGRTAIWRTRAAYLEGGLDFAFRDVVCPGKPQRYRADAQAEMAALACSSTPQGTPAPDRGVAHPGGAAPPADAPDQPRECSSAAKKTSSNPGASWCGALVP